MQLHRYGDFPSLLTDCPARFATQAGTLFERSDWYSLLAQLFEGRLQLFVAREGDSALCLPLVAEGRRLVSLSNYYTGLYGPLWAGNPSAEWRTAALNALCRRLRTELRPATVQLHPLDPESNTCRELRQALQSAGYRLADYFCFGNWHLPCAGLRFADFFSARPAAVRNTVRRSRAKLDKAGAWRIAILTEPDARLEQGLNNYEAIYRKSWKPAESHPGFVRELCRLAARQGWLRLGELQVDGNAIASQIWLVDNGTAFIFKLAYDPDAARYSPGSVLTAALMEHALDHDRVGEIDYLSGDDAYKRDWMTHRRERIGLIAFDIATPRGMAAYLRHQAGLAWRRLKP